MRTFNRIAYHTVAGVIFLIIFYLFGQSLFTDVRIGQKEIRYFIMSVRLLILAGMGIFLVLFYFWHKYIKLSKDAVKKIIIALTVLNCFFVLTSQNVPRADQQRVLEYATEMWKGNYTAFLPGNYLDIYPNQNGIVLFCYFLSIIGGGYNFLLFQMVNVLAVNCLYFFIYHYWEMYGQERRYDEILVAIGLFFPITLYVNYVYGILIGLVLATSSILWQQIYFRNRNKKSLLLSILSISLACSMKSNYLVFAIGILLVYFMDMAVHKSAKSIIGIVGILFGVLLVNSTVKTGLDIITEGASNDIKGAPHVAFVVMGLSNTEESYGWHNGYVERIYHQNNNNYEWAEKASAADLKKEIQHKLDNPHETKDFFQKKIASVWCEPSFGAFYNNRIDYQTVLQGHSHIYNELFSYTGRLQKIFYYFLEIFQGMVYLGVLLYVIYGRKNYNISRIIGLIIFLGGFIFQLFWEAKSSYAFMYFVLLIPYAVVGLGKCFDGIQNTFIYYGSDKNKTMLFKNLLWLPAGIFILMVAGNTLIIKNDNEKWDAYLSEHRYIEDGYYYLKPIEAEGDEYNENRKIYLQIDMSDTWQYEIKSIDKKARFTAIGDAVYMLPDGESDFPSDAYWHWRFQRLNGGYCIRWWNDMNKVITFDKENSNVYLSNYEENNLSQIWELKRR